MTLSRSEHVLVRRKAAFRVSFHVAAFVAFIVCMLAPGVNYAGPAPLKACPGCCSSHGGITNMCGAGGRVICADGTTSPTCLCSSCGASPPCSYTYTDWGSCQVNGTQTRSVMFSSPPGCVGTPTLSRQCVYVPPPPPFPPSLEPNYTALWWNKNEAGWGMNVNHQGDLLFVTLFTYSQSGAPMWLFASSLSLRSDGTYLGALYRATGASYDASVSGAVQIAQVGSMRLLFKGEDVATLDYSVGATTITKNIERQIFAVPVPHCVSTTQSRSSAGNFQDLWWNADESGWGLNITHQGNILFATLFTYDRTGQDLWLFGSEVLRQPDGTFAGPLYATRGPAFDASRWGAVTVSHVGNISLSFSNGEVGTLTYTYQGTTVRKNIRRQVFGPTVPMCQ